MKSCIIVDAYKFSKDYTYHLNKLNIKAIHVQSTASPSLVLLKNSNYDAKDYIANFNYEGQIEELVAELKKFSPVAIIPGTETGVLLADQLNHALNIPANLFAKTEARRNKYEMLDAINEAGIPCMQFRKVTTLNEALDWAQEYGYPVVIKPLEGAGTDGVYVCQDQKELLMHFNKVLGKKNCFNVPNSAVLIQEYLQGTEYMINTVSLNSHHYITDLWRCRKRYVYGHGMIYDREELLMANGPIQNELTKYLKLVLHALGFEKGAAHAELMYTHNGPKLIEIGARVGGNVNCEAHQQALGLDQLALNVEAYFDKKSFLKKIRYAYSIKKHMLTILLSTQQTGKIKSIPLIEVIKTCASLYWYALNVKEGDHLHPTRDLFSSPGKIILMHENRQMIENDYQKLMLAMKQGFILNSL